MENEKSEEELGQVFTSEKVAKLMIKLVESRLTIETRCLDPCIGKNVFLRHINDKLVKQLVGIEVDKSLMSPDIIKFYSKNNKSLIIGNFFDFNLKEKFEIIIMNPPYVRQEKINGLTNSKEKLMRFFAAHKFNIPKKSNLYVYFFLKALEHLNEGGKLVAITYDSWLFTQFGKSFKKYLVDTYNIEKLVHFGKGAFENVNVGAAIVLISAMPQHPEIEYYSYDSPSQLSDEPALNPSRKKVISVDDLLYFNRIYPSDINFDSAFFTTMKDLSVKKINRGTNAIVNEFFLFDEERFPGDMVKIIKNVAKISKFIVTDEWSYLLVVRPDEIDTEIRNHLTNIESEVLKDNNRYKILATKIKVDASWFVPKIKNSGNIIFNYYMRDNIHFIYNPNFINTSDNFYNMTINDRILENLCILNSNVTRYALLKFGRMQGSGLFKIQLFEFIDVPVIDVNQLNEVTRDSLRDIGKKILATNRRNSLALIEEIDNLLIKEYNMRLGVNMTVKALRQSIEKIKGGMSID